MTYEGIKETSFSWQVRFEFGHRCGPFRKEDGTQLLVWHASLDNFPDEDLELDCFEVFRMSPEELTDRLNSFWIRVSEPSMPPVPVTPFLKPPLSLGTGSGLAAETIARPGIF